jgi:hypothetical protein
MSLIELFNLVEKSSHNLRKAKKEADGLKFWQPIKKLFSFVDINAKSWKQMKHHDNVLDVPEYYIDGRGEKKIIEVNHFLIQTVRIPLTEEPSVRKIIQVALNIGQYTGSGGKKQDWMSLDNYISKAEIKNIDKQLPGDILDELKNILKPK